MFEFVMIGFGLFWLGANIFSLIMLLVCAIRSLIVPIDQTPPPPSLGDDEWEEVSFYDRLMREEARRRGLMS